MFFLTPEESSQFLTDSGWKFDDNHWPLVPPANFKPISFMVSDLNYQIRLIFRSVIDALPGPDGSDGAWLFWPVHYGENSASTNDHLYYRVRQSYHDYRQVSKAPGHVFLKHESQDLLTFIELALLFHWDFHLVSDEWGALHNDGCLVIYAEDSPFFDAAKKALTSWEVQWWEGSRGRR